MMHVAIKNNFWHGRARNAGSACKVLFLRLLTFNHVLQNGRPLVHLEKLGIGFAIKDGATKQSFLAWWVRSDDDGPNDPTQGLSLVYGA